MSDELTPAQKLDAAAAALGLTMVATFVPFSRSRNAKPGKDGYLWRSLNWTVTIARNGRDFLTTDYAQGEGHAPASKRDWAGGRGDKDKAIALELEHGRSAAGWFMGRAPYLSGVPIDPPALADVLHSLVLDASVLDSGTFEDWASEYGYDTDSRKAETSYRACLDIALRLRGAIGDAGIEALRTAGEDF